MTTSKTTSALTQRDRLNIQLFSVSRTPEFEKLVSQSENYTDLLWSISELDNETLDKQLATFQTLIENKTDAEQEEFFQTLKKYLWTKN